MKHRPLLWETDTAGVDINMSPLIDCVFLLLIFFIVTTVFVKDTGITVNKPDAVTSVAAEPDALRLAIGAQGEIYLGGHPVAINNLRSTISVRLNGADTPILLLADKALASGRLVAVMDECRKAGGKNILIATRQPTAGDGS